MKSIKSIYETLSQPKNLSFKKENFHVSFFFWQRKITIAQTDPNRDVDRIRSLIEELQTNFNVVSVTQNDTNIFTLQFDGSTNLQSIYSYIKSSGAE